MYMINALLGTKIEQSQQFTESGIRIPVTTIQAGPCWVTSTHDFDGFTNIQLAYGTSKKQTKPEKGHIKKSGLDITPRFLREIRVVGEDNTEEVKNLLGKQILVSDVFVAGDLIRVTGTSKGKGFAGVVKRHHFRGGPRSHGQSDRERAPGSIGQTTTPGRVYKGKRMAGHMGVETITVRNLKIVAIDPETGILTVKGLVPGAKHGLLLLQKETVKKT